MRFSHRTTLAHWLMRTGRSRQDCTHFPYIVPMIASEVGRTASRSSSFSEPAAVIQASLRAEALNDGEVIAIVHAPGDPCIPRHLELRGRGRRGRCYRRGGRDARQCQGIEVHQAASGGSGAPVGCGRSRSACAMESATRRFRSGP